MKFVVLPILSALALAGCGGTTGSLSPPPISTTQVSSVIASVQDAVNRGCNVAVEAASVADILAALGVPYVGMVADIAQQVCGAFNRSGSSRNGTFQATVSVKGRVIPVRGVRV